jgi:hypothetical protein
LKTQALTFLEKAKRLQVAGDAEDGPERKGKKCEGSAAERLESLVFENSQGMIGKIT